MKICTNAEKLKFMTAHRSESHQSALCFENKDQVVLTNNWWEDTFENIIVVIEACMNTPEYNKCESLPNIFEWSSKNFFYILSQRNNANKAIYHS